MNSNNDPGTQLSARLIHLLELLSPSVQSSPERLARLALKHGVLDHISAPSTTPPEVSSQIRDIRLRQSARSFAQTRQLGQLTRLLQSKEVPHLVLKGPVFSQFLYGNPCTRSSSDLDLLIDPRQLSFTHRLLGNEGYTVRSPLPGEGRRKAEIRYLKARTYQSGTAQCSLDLHWKLFSQWIAHEISFAQLWSRKQTVQLEEGWECHTLGNEDTILFAAFHAAQDGFCRLRHLLDIGLLLRRLSYSSVSIAKIASVRQPLMNLVLTLVSDLLGFEFAGTRRFFEAPGESENFWLKWARLYPDVPKLELLHPSLWSQFRGSPLLKALNAVTTPSHDDIMSLELSPSLTWAYRPLRILRLTGKLLTRGLEPVQFRDE